MKPVQKRTGSASASSQDSQDVTPTCRLAAQLDSSTLLPAPADPTTTVSRLSAPSSSRPNSAALVRSVSGSVVGRNLVSANRKLRVVPRRAVSCWSTTPPTAGAEIEMSGYCIIVDRGTSTGQVRRLLFGCSVRSRNPATALRWHSQRLTLERVGHRRARHAYSDHMSIEGRQRGVNLVSSRTYEITFVGQAGTVLQAEFDDCEISVGPSTTTLRLELADQGALHGLLQRIVSFRLELIDVSVVAPPADIGQETSNCRPG